MVYCRLKRLSGVSYKVGWRIQKESIKTQVLKKFGASQVAVVKNPPANVGDVRDVGWIPGLGRSPGGGHDNPLQCSCLENPMDRGAWQALELLSN